jgi:hypothetical protein
MNRKVWTLKRCPWCRTCGGSSGGEAALIASGGSVLGLGSGIMILHPHPYLFKSNLSMAHSWLTRDWCRRSSSLGIGIEKSKNQAPLNRLSDVDVIRESLIKPPDFRARFRRWWESTSACSLVWYSRIQANERAHIHAGTEPHCFYPLAESHVHSRAVAIILPSGRIYTDC